jgi:hypothetical protein
LFGANTKNNIKVQFHNGTASVPGYIVKQKGSKRFLCEDADGNTKLCRMVMKDSASLAAGEMSITFKYDDGTVRHAYKIAAHKISINPATNANTTVGMVSQGWTFATSTTDKKWQVEEAGTDVYMTSATDYEGDEVYNASLDYPAPGSGTYKTAATALSGLTYAAVGTPYAPGGSLTTVPNSHPGLRRTKYDGKFASASNSAASTWNYSFFSTATKIKGIADTKVSWGQQSDGAGTGEHDFSCEWKGYVQAPKSGNFNIYAESDDHIAVWIGTNATGTPANATRSLAANNQTLPGSGAVAGTTVNTNSVTLVAGKWYPIRMWHAEFTGGCKAQLYLQAADGTVYNGSDLTFAYNNTTQGY